MTETLVIGSQNRNKAAELAELLDHDAWSVQSLAEFPPLPEPEEDGDTFQANAIKKALYYAKALGLRCVADDSGLVVDVLDGAPGVYSARYAGPHATDKENNTKLLHALADVPDPERTARFVCCAAVVRPGEEPHLATGVVEGHIARAPHGRGGFGYDPLFIPEGHDVTFGEMTIEEKHAVSHRGRAFRELGEYLATLQ